MKFSQRLAYYLFGLLLGGFIVYYFFNEKDAQFCYLPNCRVLKDLRSKPINVSEKAQISFDDALITMNDIKACLTYGEVDFSKSNIADKGGKLYIIEGQNTKKETFIFQTDNEIVIKKLKKYQKKPCRIRISIYICTTINKGNECWLRPRRNGRVVECGSLENC